MVSGSISLRYSRFFSPFPHGTGSLSVSREYLALADGPAGFAQGSTCPALLRVPLRFCRLRVRAFHPLRGRFPTASARRPSSDNAALQPPSGRDRAGLGWSPFARRYLGNHSCFLFLRVLRCFSSPRWPPGCTGMADLPSAGLSHSGTRGSKAVCASPRIFAAYRALRRLREPRHPPCALACLPSRPPARRCAGGGVCREPSRAPGNFAGRSHNSGICCRAALQRAARNLLLRLFYCPICQIPTSGIIRKKWRITDSNR